MSVADGQIFVKSHVARDLLQNATLFKTDKLIVWEYVSNGLQYVDHNTSPMVAVTLNNRAKEIRIKDNGRGMDWAGLQNFFVMHGENLDRKEGRPGRGRFGTGKSAAFGIANILEITTVRAGKRSRVILTRTEVEEMSSEEPIPVRIIEREATTDEVNGTVVRISNIHLRTLDQPGVIKYIERHLARWPKNVTVFVNNHECEFAEPALARESVFTPEGAFEKKLGKIRLILKVAKSPLDQDLRGVTIYTNGVWHETTLAGSEGREMSQYIFGEVDVPKLDEDNSPIAPFDLSRSMRLNPSNETVQAIYGFIGQKVELVRRSLVEEDKRRRAGEEAKKLEQQADEIARVINEDFEAFRQRLAKAKAKTSGGSDLLEEVPGAGPGNEDLLFGADLPAEVVSPTGGVGVLSGDGDGGCGVKDLAPQVQAANVEKDKKGRMAGGKDRNAKARGGFQVKFEHMGTESHRAVYIRDQRTIYVNLDHPQLAAARGLESIDDPVFQRLAYEVAFSEYAVALAAELASRDEFYDPSEAVVEVRETLNRVARKGANLYSK